MLIGISCTLPELLVVLLLISCLLTKPISHHKRLGFPDFLSASNKAQNQIKMHLGADGCRESLISNPLLNRLLAETDGINNALHFSELLVRDVDFLAGDILVLSIAVGSASLPWPLVIRSDYVAVLFGELAAEAVNKITLLVG